MEKGFTKEDTLALKGVAVMLLLCHHLFTSTERYVNYLIYYTEDDSFNITAIIAQYAKLCVPMFVMLGAYGLSLVYGKWLEKKRSAVSFVLDRYLSLMAGFLVIFVLGLSRASRRVRFGRVIATQPAVGPKLSRARCRNTALPRPAMRGRVLWSISTIRS